VSDGVSENYNTRLLQVVSTKVCSRGETGSLSAGMRGLLSPLEKRRLGGEAPIPSSISGKDLDAGDSAMSILDKYRIASDFCKSALTRRMNGMLSCERDSYEKQ
jgi:hypothetical protein